MGRLVTCLTGEGDEVKAMIGMRANSDASGRPRLHWYGGAADQTELEGWAREAVIDTYLHPCETPPKTFDQAAGTDWSIFITATAGDSSDAATIEQLMVNANEQLRAVPAISRAHNEVASRLDRMVGAQYVR